MRRFLLSLAALPFTTLIGGYQSTPPALSGTMPGLTPDTPFGRQLGRARAKASLPAVAGARVTLDGPPVTHAFGVRRLTATDTVTADDHFHLGSNSKAITATLLGALVEDGVLTWDRTIGSSFPELAAGMPAAWRSVTLRQLLTHRSGVAEFMSPDEILGMPDDTRRGTPAEQRLAFAAWVLQRPPAGRAGEFIYSNAGYGIAVAIAERATGRPWERLLQERLFDPLGIPARAVRIGWPGLAGSAPWGHVADGGSWESHDPTDNRIIAIPAALAPAGDLSMTMSAYARFLQMHVRGLAGRDDVLRATTIRVLHEADGDYAMGWGVQQNVMSTVHFHEGSAGTFHVVTLLDPQRGIAVATVANAGGDRAADAIRDAADRALRP